MAQEFDVTNLAASIDYQKDAVVSRTLIKKETGTVTIFAFSENQGLSEHTAPFDAMVNIFDGLCNLQPLIKQVMKSLVE